MSSLRDQRVADFQKLREEFLRFLTEDSEVKDGRRKEFNQAIFDAERGYAIWTDLTLDMVMGKFDKAARNLK
jgi:hypothetical protein